MHRVIDPLERMGARIESTDEGRAPLHIRGGRSLKGIPYRSPVASAQVKTAVLLAGLHAEGDTRVQEPLPSRNHTELALIRFGVPVSIDEDGVRITGGSELQSTRIRIPGDISSAAFFIVGAAVFPGSNLLVADVGLNPTRTGFIEVLQSMGARVTIEEEKEQDGEVIGTVRVQGAELAGVEVPAERVPGLIDEIPRPRRGRLVRTWGNNHSRGLRTPGERVRSDTCFGEGTACPERRRGRTAGRAADKRGKADAGGQSRQLRRSPHRDGVGSGITRCRRSMPDQRKKRRERFLP